MSVSEQAEVPEKRAPETRPKKEAARKEGFLTKLEELFARPVSDRTRIRVLAGSAILTTVLVLVATFGYPGYLSRPAYDTTMVEIFIVGLIAPSVVDIMNRRYRAMIDARIPDFLREIGESQRTGMPFARALETASKSNYGPLSVELQKAMAKMSWGYTFEDALAAFADSAHTALAHRAAVLLEEVGRSGGKMLEVLDSVYEHIREVTNLQRERSKQLAPYVFVIYASFGVYLFVVYILFTTFFAQISNLQHTGAPFGSNVDPVVYYIWFYHMSIIEAVFGGLVAGKIGAGSSGAGLKHVLVLLLISFVAFNFFITY
jgi:flagellar protein FlaJ